MNNHLYNLYSQLVQECRSAYRLRTFYLRDARGCQKCKNYWNKLLKNKEDIIKEIFDLIKSHR